MGWVKIALKWVSDGCTLRDSREGEGGGLEINEALDNRPVR